MSHLSVEHFLDINSIFFLIPLGLLLFLSWVPRSVAEPVIAGLLSSRLESFIKGQILIEELNCVACHKAPSTSPDSFTVRSKKSPRLAEIGARVNPNYLEAFILDSHGTHPSTTMPEMLLHLEDEERKQVASALTHFLLSLKKNDFSLQAPDTVAAQQGYKLFHSRGCAACHSPRDARGGELLPKNSNPLGALEKKYSFTSLVHFLRQPHLSRPSGRMPDLRLSGQEIERIAHYLLQETRVPGALSYTQYRGAVWEGLESEQVTAERAGLVKDFALESVGQIHHHTGIKYEGWIQIPRSGRYLFFLKMNGGSLLVDGKQLLQQEPSDRRGVKQLEASTELSEGWVRIQLTYFHTGHDPTFSLEMAGPNFDRQSIPSSMLSISDQPIPVLKKFELDPERVTRGRLQFVQLGCAHCHDDLQLTSPSAPSLVDLNLSKGCLSQATGPWPKFNLSLDQKKWITEALPPIKPPTLTEQQRLHKSLVTFNCIACHERTQLGGIATERKGFFTGSQGALGDQGRLPPPLSQVGAKLKPEAIAEVLLHGKRHRNYVDASMPHFGEANVSHLVELFGKVDTLEKAPIPQVTQNLEFKNQGWEMVGSEGLNCIACHEFNGQKSGEVSALDLVSVTARLKKNWFHLYMRDPARFHPTVIMPSYWPDGQSTRPKSFGGDPAQQIEAVWLYLEDGGRAKKPSGLSRQSKELRVSDVAEIYRGRSSIGYRGIAVGYPERLNLVFDSEEMALRQLWKGDFVNTDFGSFSPRGTDSILFPSGIPFHRLKSMEENWPYKGKKRYPFPQDHGYQFRGYQLDLQRRPTFLYVYGDISVEDFFEEGRDATGIILFKRTLTFKTMTQQVPFHFRVASGRKITQRSKQSFSIDQLQLRIVGGPSGLLREGNPNEILIPLTLSAGRTTLTLEYQW